MGKIPIFPPTFPSFKIFLDVSESMKPYLVEIEMEDHELDQRVVQHVDCHGVSPKELTHSAPAIINASLISEGVTKRIE